MKKIFVLCLLAVLPFGVSAAIAQQADPLITLQRTPCFGTCPAYTVSIYADGTIRYNGENAVDVTGEQVSTIAPETVGQMVEAFADAGYFEWNEAYTNQTVSDLPTIITAVTHNGQTHRIERYAGDTTAPLALPFLEVWIDRMTDSKQWTGAEIDSSTASNGTNSAVVTLERGACFGECPVYTVALFTDGTVIYSGIANVDMLGVKVYKTGPAEIERTTQLAGILGYFEWDASYEEQVRTDQSTVITSVWYNGQTQKIIHYSGDPNAPIGLIWFEDSIDQLITNVSGS